MTLSEINKHIIEAGTKSAADYLDTFWSHEQEIIDILNNYDGLQTEMYLHNSPEEIVRVRYAALFSDLVSLYMSNTEREDYHLTFIKEDSKFFQEQNITIYGKLIDEINPEKHKMVAGYMHHSESSIRKSLLTLQPLLNAEKSIFRPLRSVLVDNRDRSKKEGGTVYYADGNTNINHWHLKDNFSEESLPIKYYLNAEKSQQMFRLTLPYLRNIDLETLTRILEEEKDILRPFRRDLKKIVMEFDEHEENIEEYQYDVLKPHVDSINRKFRNYKDNHKWNVAGSVGLFALSLLKVSVSPEHIPDFIASVIGTGGMGGLFVSNSNYQNKLNELREDPYFLLWRIQRQPKL